MGVSIDKVPVPVCNSFRPKIIKDQLCYTVDPNEYKTKNIEDRLSLTLFINHNEDRQVTFSNDLDISNDGNDGTTMNNFIFIETLGNRIS